MKTARTTCWTARTPTTSVGGAGRGAGLATLAGAALLCAGLLFTGPALADDPGDGSDGSDPTVGSLPMTGGDDAGWDGLDQHVYLYGDVQAIRATMTALRGERDEAAWYVIPLPDGKAWVEFYGDIELVLDLQGLRDVELGIGAGFWGGGMATAVQTGETLGSPFQLDVGRNLTLHPARLVATGLLDQPLVVHGLHEVGQRTRTTLEAGAGVLTIRQDV